MSRIYQFTFIFAGIFLGCVAFLAAPRVFAVNDSPQTFTLDGQLFQTGTTTPLSDSNVVLKVQILDPGGTCLLYEETQTVSTSTTDGYFHINVGSATGAGKRTVNDPGRTMTQVFQNLTAISASSVPGQTCAGGTYTPTAGAVRYFRITVTPSSTNIADTLTPDIAIDSVPQALVAQSVQGLERISILQTASGASLSLTQANLEALFTTPAYTNLQSILAGNFMRQDSSGATLPSYAATPAGLSTGDMWYDSVTNQIKYQSNSGVQTIGTSAAGVSSLTMSTDLSVNGVTAGTISSGSGTIGLSDTGITAGSYTKVTVDAKGRIWAGISLSESDLPSITTPGKVSGSAITSGTISGSTGINTSGNLITTGTISGLTVQATNLRIYNGAHYVQLTAQAMSSDLSFALPTADGISGQVLQTNGAGVLSWGAAATSGTISVGQGGTGTTSYANNQLIASNGTGTALVATTCPQYQVISFDASGNITCSNVSSLAGMILNGGNSTAGTISIGTNDNHALSFKTNNSTAMTISQNGNVGVGTTNPQFSQLHVFSDVLGSWTQVRAEALNSGSFAGVNSVADGSSISLKAYGSANPNTLGDGTTFADAVTLESGSSGYAPSKMIIYSNGTAPLQFATNTAVRMSINSSGNVGIGTTSPTTALDISGALTARGMSSAPSVSASSTGRIYYDYSANKFKVSQNGAAYVDLVSAGGGGSATGVSAAAGTVSGPSISFSGDGDSGFYSNGSNIVGVTAGGTNTFNFSQTSLSSPTSGGAYLTTANGTSIAPTYSFSGDTDTGWFSPAANTLAAATNGAERIRIDSSGNVGVGTGAPTAAVHILGTNGNTSSNLQNVLTVTGGANAGTGRGGGISLVAGTGDANSGGAYLTLPGGGWSAGNVVLSGGAQNGGGAGTVSIIGTTGTAGGSTYSGGPVNLAGGTSGGSFKGGDINVTAGTGGSSNGAGGDVLLNGGAKGGAAADGNVILANSRGKVGVGTTTPGAKLQILNSAPASVSGQEVLRLSGIMDSMTVGSGPSLNFSHTDNSVGGYIRSYTEASNQVGLSFGTYNTSLNTRMHITAGGNVGIGTTSPSAKLEVVGAATSRANIISSGNAVDLSLSNVHVLKSVGSSTLALTNMTNGGSYTLIISDITQTTYTFTGCTNTYFSPTNGQTFQRSTYSVLAVIDTGVTDCYISWVTGFN